MSTAVPPTSVSDVVNQFSKIGGIRFGAALVIYWSLLKG